MSISVIEPIELAIAHTKRVLFQPFKLEKWCVLGFCAFLSMLGEGGGCFNIPTNWGGGSGGGGGSGPGGQEVLDWIKANLGWLIIAAVVVVALSVALGVLLTWLRCRGKFMFLDGIVHNRGAVVEPWKMFRREGNSLTWCFVLISLALAAAYLGLIGGAVAIAWPDIQAQRFGELALLAVILGGLIVLLLVILQIAFMFLLENFVVPTMYLRRQGVLAAWSIVRHELLPGHGGAIVLFFLMRLLLGIAVSAIALVLTCATCCIAALPYVGTVILLPLLVFYQSYTLFFIEQFGPQWLIFPRGGPDTRCVRCGYDLHGTSALGICPECGTPFSPAPPPLPGQGMV